MVGKSSEEVRDIIREEQRLRQEVRDTFPKANDRNFRASVNDRNSPYNQALRSYRNRIRYIPQRERDRNVPTVSEFDNDILDRNDTVSHQFGTRRITPKLIKPSYNIERTQKSAFVLGVGDVDADNVRINDIPIERFKNISFNIIKPGNVINYDYTRFPHKEFQRDVYLPKARDSYFLNVRFSKTRHCFSVDCYGAVQSSGTANTVNETLYADTGRLETPLNTFISSAKYLEQSKQLFEVGDIVRIGTFTGQDDGGSSSSNENFRRNQIRRFLNANTLRRRALFCQSPIYYRGGSDWIISSPDYRLRNEIEVQRPYDYRYGDLDDGSWFDSATPEQYTTFTCDDSLSQIIISNQVLKWYYNSSGVYTTNSSYPQQNPIDYLNVHSYDGVYKIKDIVRRGHLGTISSTSTTPDECLCYVLDPADVTHWADDSTDWFRTNPANPSANKSTMRLLDIGVPVNYRALSEQSDNYNDFRSMMGFNSVVGVSGSASNPTGFTFAATSKRFQFLLPPTSRFPCNYTCAILTKEKYVNSTLFTNNELNSGQYNHRNHTNRMTITEPRFSELRYTFPTPVRRLLVELYYPDGVNIKPPNPSDAETDGTYYHGYTLVVVSLYTRQEYDTPLHILFEVRGFLLNSKTITLSIPYNISTSSLTEKTVAVSGSNTKRMYMYTDEFGNEYGVVSTSTTNRDRKLRELRSIGGITEFSINRVTDPYIIYTYFDMDFLSSNKPIIDTVSSNISVNVNNDSHTVSYSPAGAYTDTRRTIRSMGDSTVHYTKSGQNLDIIVRGIYGSMKVRESGSHFSYAGNYTLLEVTEQLRDDELLDSKVLTCDTTPKLRFDKTTLTTKESVLETLIDDVVTNSKYFNLSKDISTGFSSSGAYGVPTYEFPATTYYDGRGDFWKYLLSLTAKFKSSIELYSRITTDTEYTQGYELVQHHDGIDNTKPIVLLGDANITKDTLKYETMDRFSSYDGAVIRFEDSEDDYQVKTLYINNQAKLPYEVDGSGITKRKFAYDYMKYRYDEFRLLSTFVSCGININALCLVYNQIFLSFIEAVGHGQSGNIINMYKDAGVSFLRFDSNFKLPHADFTDMEMLFDRDNEIPNARYHYKYRSATQVSFGQPANNMLNTRANGGILYYTEFGGDSGLFGSLSVNFTRRFGNNSSDSISIRTLRTSNANQNQTLNDNHIMRIKLSHHNVSSTQARQLLSIQPTRNNNYDVYTGFRLRSQMDNQVTWLHEYAYENTSTPDYVVLQGGVTTSPSYVTLCNTSFTSSVPVISANRIGVHLHLHRTIGNETFIPDSLTTEGYNTYTIEYRFTYNYQGSDAYATNRTKTQSFPLSRYDFHETSDMLCEVPLVLNTIDTPSGNSKLSFIQVEARVRRYVGSPITANENISQSFGIAVVVAGLFYNSNGSQFSHRLNFRLLKAGEYPTGLPSGYNTVNNAPSTFQYTLKFYVDTRYRGYNTDLEDTIDFAGSIQPQSGTRSYYQIKDSITLRGGQDQSISIPFNPLPLSSDVYHRIPDLVNVYVGLTALSGDNADGDYKADTNLVFQLESIDRHIVVNNELPQVYSQDGKYFPFEYTRGLNSDGTRSDGLSNFYFNKMLYRNVYYSGVEEIRLNQRYDGLSSNPTDEATFPIGNPMLYIENTYNENTTTWQYRSNNTLQYNGYKILTCLGFTGSRTTDVFKYFQLKTATSQSPINNNISLRNYRQDVLDRTGLHPEPNEYDEIIRPENVEIATLDVPNRVTTTFPSTIISNIGNVTYVYRSSDESTSTAVLTSNLSSRKYSIHMNSNMSNTNDNSFLQFTSGSIAMARSFYNNEISLGLPLILLRHSTGYSDITISGTNTAGSFPTSYIDSLTPDENGKRVICVLPIRMGFQSRNASGSNLVTYTPYVDVELTTDMFDKQFIIYFTLPSNTSIAHLLNPSSLTTFSPTINDRIRDVFFQYRIPNPLPSGIGSTGINLWLAFPSIVRMVQKVPDTVYSHGRFYLDITPTSEVDGLKVLYVYPTISSNSSSEATGVHYVMKLQLNNRVFQRNTNSTGTTLVIKFSEGYSKVVTVTNASYTHSSTALNNLFIQLTLRVHIRDVIINDSIRFSYISTPTTVDSVNNTTPEYKIITIPAFREYVQSYIDTNGSDNDNTSFTTGFTSISFVSS